MERTTVQFTVKRGLGLSQGSEDFFQMPYCLRLKRRASQPAWKNLLSSKILPMPGDYPPGPQT